MEEAGRRTERIDPAGRCEQRLRQGRLLPQRPNNAGGEKGGNSRLTRRNERRAGVTAPTRPAERWCFEKTMFVPGHPRMYIVTSFCWEIATRECHEFHEPASRSSTGLWRGPLSHSERFSRTIAGVAARPRSATTEWMTFTLIPVGWRTNVRAVESLPMGKNEGRVT